LHVAKEKNSAAYNLMMNAIQKNREKFKFSEEEEDTRNI
jgi:hypothetical protein